MVLDVHGRALAYRAECRGFEFRLGQLLFPFSRKRELSWVVLNCLPCCLVQFLILDTSPSLSHKRKHTTFIGKVHVGTRHFVLYREVVLSSEVKMNYNRKVNFWDLKVCPLSRGLSCCVPYSEVPLQHI